MKTISLLCFASLLAVGASGAAALDDAVREATLDYAKRLEAATQEMAGARARIATEEEPLLRSIGERQQAIRTLEREVRGLESGVAQADDLLVKTRREWETRRSNLAYLSAQSFEVFKGLNESLVPGEASIRQGQIGGLQEKFENPAKPIEAGEALAALDLAIDRLEQLLGGHVAQGSALSEADNRLLPGKFAFLGPEVFFLSDDGSLAGTIRRRDGQYPMVTSLPGWTSERASALFQGGQTRLPLDPSGGKALSLKETQGGVVKHIRMGGMVAVIILLVGVLAVVLIVMKLNDARNLKVEESARVREVLRLIAAGKLAEARAAVGAVARVTRELFLVGLDNAGKPAEALEDHLMAHAQQQRLHFERRLPLLTVIATASPLLGLLGTVMGMVKTFALITVFGTGNAAKLSSGISEVLVATELGLAVAIPSLVAHGFLSHRIQKDLALLEKHTMEFLAAMEEARARPAAERIGA